MVKFDIAINQLHRCKCATYLADTYLAFAPSYAGPGFIICPSPIVNRLRGHPILPALLSSPVFLLLLLLLLFFNSAFGFFCCCFFWAGVPLRVYMSHLKFLHNLIQLA